MPWLGAVAKYELLPTNHICISMKYSSVSITTQPNPSPLWPHPSLFEEQTANGSLLKLYEYWKLYIFLTLLVGNRNISGDRGKYSAIDSFVPCVDWSVAAMVLTMENKRVLFSTKDIFTELCHIIVCKRLIYSYVSWKTVNATMLTFRGSTCFRTHVVTFPTKSHVTVYEPKVERYACTYFMNRCKKFMHIDVYIFMNY